MLAFLEQSEFAEKILLSSLEKIFYSHFEVLLNQSFDRKSFLENFTISNILNACNGRKYYNAKLWQDKRWYFQGVVTTYTQEKLNCFCEGRPWKKESMWNSQSNTPSTEKYDFYWCKTSYCAERNDSRDVQKSFQHWTITEIASVLNITIEKIARAKACGVLSSCVWVLWNCIQEVISPIDFDFRGWAEKRWLDILPMLQKEALS